MRQVLLVRFGEVHLKGLNRPYFLKKLTDNVKRAVRPRVISATFAAIWS